MKMLVASVLLGLVGAVPAVADDAFLTSLVGDWIGRGTMKTSAEAAPERVYCKIGNTLIEGGATLAQKGRCSLASTSGSVNGSITADGAGDYRGTLDSLASNGPAILQGKGTTGRLDLDATFVDALTNQPAESVTTIELLSKGGYRLSTVRVDPRTGSTYTSSEISFSAK
jgi:CubicO group peptidase (beta-lactamase class C family)